MLGLMSFSTFLKNYNQKCVFLLLLNGDGGISFFFVFSIEEKLLFQGKSVPLCKQCVFERVWGLKWEIGFIFVFVWRGHPPREWYVTPIHGNCWEEGGKMKGGGMEVGVLRVVLYSVCTQVCVCVCVLCVCVCVWCVCVCVWCVCVA